MCGTLINGSWSIIVLCFIYFSFGFNPKILAERPKECATWVLENTLGVSPERLLSLQAMYIHCLLRTHYWRRDCAVLEILVEPICQSIGCNLYGQ